MFDLYILSPLRVIYDKEAMSVRVDGDESEFEFLSFHAKCIGRLRAGEIIINSELSIPIKSGIVRFLDNQCTILCEEAEGYAPIADTKGKEK